MRKISMSLFLTFFISIALLQSCKKESTTTPSTDTSNTVTDIDGNVYKTVKIGNQIWMAENLKVSRYKNGDSIPNLTDTWGTTTKGAWCWYNHTKAIEVEYGKLYNWYATNDSRGLSPKGWHIPTAEEFKTLIDYLGTDSAGAKLKETGNFHWSANNVATNSTGFTARPGGLRNHQQGYFSGIGATAFFWTSTLATNDIANYLVLYDVWTKSSFAASYVTHGFSVRCIKD